MESDGNGVFTPPPTTNHSKEQPPPLPTSPLPDDDETDRNNNIKIQNRSNLAYNILSYLNKYPSITLRNLT